LVGNKKNNFPGSQEWMTCDQTWLTTCVVVPWIQPFIIHGEFYKWTPYVPFYSPFSSSLSFSHIFHCFCFLYFSYFVVSLSYLFVVFFVLLLYIYIF
jgi:hypothetical protein